MSSVPSAASRPIEAYQPKTLQRQWGREVFVCETPHYLTKILYMNAGTKGGLQQHVEKDESFHLLSGEAWVEHDDGTGTLVGNYMYPGQTYHIPPRATHRVEALTDCVFIEGSTPHYDDRYHAEHLYGQKTQTGGLPSTWEMTSDGEFIRCRG